MKLLALYLWLCGSATNRVTLDNSRPQPIYAVRMDEIYGFQPHLRLGVYEFQPSTNRIETIFRLAP